MLQDLSLMSKSSLMSLLKSKKLSLLNLTKTLEVVGSHSSALTLDSQRHQTVSKAKKKQIKFRQAQNKLTHLISTLRPHLRVLRKLSLTNSFFKILSRHQWVQADMLPLLVVLITVTECLPLSL